MMDVKRWRARLQGLLHARDEREWLEFKRNNADPEEIGQYISALSNSATLDGQPTAYLIWGVEDGTHHLVGTSFRPREQKVGNEELENWLARMLEPRLHFRLHEFIHDGKQVVILEIPACEHMPVRWKNVAYIRVGSYKKKLVDYPEKERALWLRASRTSFEKGIAANSLTGEEVLASIDYPAYFEMSGQSVPSSRNAILERLHHERMAAPLGADKWDITNLGGLLFARKLTDFPTLARKALRVIVYKGRDRTQTIKEQVGLRGYAAGFEGLNRLHQ